MDKITPEKIISITIIGVDTDGKRFSQSLEGDKAEAWILEVDERLNDYSLIKRWRDFPSFDWKVDYGVEGEAINDKSKDK